MSTHSGLGKCESCEAGSFSINGASTCQRCKPGFFSSEKEANKCFSCDALGRSACAACACSRMQCRQTSVCTHTRTRMRRYQPNEGQTSCKSCPAASIQQLYASSADARVMYACVRALVTCRYANRTDGADCRCQRKFFSHMALTARTQPFAPIYDCQDCIMLGMSGGEVYADCQGFDDNITGDLYAPVAKAGYYGVRWAAGEHIRYAFHACAPSSRCLSVVQRVRVANEASHVFSSLVDLTTSSNPISRCKPTLRGFLCSQACLMHA